MNASGKNKASLAMRRKKLKAAEDPPVTILFGSRDASAITCQASRSHSSLQEFSHVCAKGVKKEKMMFVQMRVYIR